MKNSMKQDIYPNVWKTVLAGFAAAVVISVLGVFICTAMVNAEKIDAEVMNWIRYVLWSLSAAAGCLTQLLIDREIPILQYCIAPAGYFCVLLFCSILFGNGFTTDVATAFGCIVFGAGSMLGIWHIKDAGQKGRYSYYERELGKF